MSSNVIPLSSIKTNIEQSQNLVLSEDILRKKVLDFLKLSFHWRQDYSPKISNIQNIKGADNYLIFSGTFEDFSPWKNITVKFCLFESSELPAERHTIFRINLPEDSSAETYLGQYSLAVDESPSPSEITFNINLHRYLGSINFINPKVIIFSSLDYSEDENSNYPKISISQEQIITNQATGKKLYKGVNFIADIALTNELSSYLYALNNNQISIYFDALLTGTENTSNLLAYENQCLCLIYSIEYYSLETESNENIPHLKIRLNPQNITSQTISFLNLEYHEISLIIPLVNRYRDEFQILIDGIVKITINNQSVSFNVQGILESYYQQLYLSFYNFPTLQQIIELVEQNTTQGSLVKDYFPEPLNRLLNIKLTELRMGLSLGNQSISQIGFSLTAQNDIDLVENIISLKPSLSMDIYAPLESEFRSIKGQLQGTWHLGKTDFITTLDYPDFNFYAGMADNQNLDVDAFVQLLLPGILPIGSRITFTKMELYGNFYAKTFSAAIAVDTNSSWEFTLAGRTFALNSIDMGMTHTEQGNFYAMEGQLILADLPVFISAAYDTVQGWRLSGGTSPNGIINITSIIHDLLEGIALPDNLPDLKLKNILFSAVPKIGEYSIRGETAEDWKLIEGLTIKVDQFTGNKTQGTALSGILWVSITIESVVVILKAQKSSSTSGGWQFEGSTFPGQTINFDVLIKWLEGSFGTTPTPSAIGNLQSQNKQIENIQASFNTTTKNFTFTCDSKLSIDEATIAITVAINITQQADGSYNKYFAGHITIGSLKFALIFGTDTTSTTFLAAYHDDQTISVKELIGYIAPNLQNDIPEGLEISLKDALFAYSQKKIQATTLTNFLFGLNIGSGINLSNLPLVGQQFPPNQTIKLSLQVLVSKSDFTTDEIKNLNKLYPEGGISLPQDQAITSRLSLATLIQLGNETQQLQLPVAINQTTGQLQTTTPSINTPSSQDTTQWFKLQKSFGAVHFERIGLNYKDSRIWVLLDAGFSLAGLSLSLDGLSVNSPLTKFEPQFDLKGLGIDYKGGDTLEIGGAFLRQQVTQNGITYDEYNGAAVIKFNVKGKALNLSAIGSYSYIEGHPSLFIYALLNYPIGGPSFFFVTGLAAGFGYNRALKIPTIDQVATFPLVAEAISPPQTSTSNLDKATQLTQELTKLQQYIPPETGQIFLAVGVKFTSFKTIDSFVLLTVAFGNRFELNILGLSTLIAPPQAGATPVAEVQLALKASFLPEEGFLGINAQLTPNSYILSKACHLTGGFAFYSWFAPNEHEGDFVLTLGGYHPRFQVPEHYPKVPPLALNWQVNNELQIKADAYFALTASAIMAGGHLQATWNSGALSAWFNAGADFLMSWKPYHYDISIYIDMGVSYTFEFFGTQHITIELGADLHIWGPEFSGLAQIHLWIISFDVRFGSNASQAPTPIDWSTFKTSFLPGNNDICSIAVKDGLVTKVNQDDKSDLGVINAKNFCLVTNSVIPAKKAVYQETDIKTDGINAKFGIGSMGVSSDKLTSDLIINVTRNEIAIKAEEFAQEFACTPVVKKVPAGLWGESLTPDLNGAQFVENTLSGLEIKPKEQHKAGQSHVIDRTNLPFSTELINNAYKWENIQAFNAMPFDNTKTEEQNNSARKQRISETIVDNRVKVTRENLLKGLNLNIEEIDISKTIADDFFISPEIAQLVK